MPLRLPASLSQRRLFQGLGRPPHCLVLREESYRAATELSSQSRGRPKPRRELLRLESRCLSRRVPCLPSQKSQEPQSPELHQSLAGSCVEISERTALMPEVTFPSSPLSALSRDRRQDSLGLRRFPPREQLPTREFRATESGCLKVLR